MLICIAWRPAVLLALAPLDVSVCQAAVTPELCEQPGRGCFSVVFHLGSLALLT